MKVHSLVDSIPLASGVSDDAWLSLATNLADIGRWVYYPEDGTCVLDPVLQRMSGLKSDAPIDAALFFDRIHEEDRAAVALNLDEAVEEGKPFDTHYRYTRDDGSMFWLKGKGRKIVTDDSSVVIGTVFDVTDLQNAIITNRLLANEMAHRVKNLISLVSGMFRMAQQTTDDAEALGVAYLGRLDALTALNDLIFESEGRSVSIEGLFARVFKPLMTDPRVRLEVADLSLNGTSAQTLVLAINELMTNAVKYGALAENSGRLSVTIRVDDAADTFDLAWHETVPGEKITPPDTSGGFGMNVLTRMTKHTFDGDPRITWRPDGLSFTCRWKASEMSDAQGSIDHEQRLFEEAARATAAVQRMD